MKKHLVMPAVFPVSCHTDFIGQGSTFVVIRGMKTDGLLFVKQAIVKGAQAIVIEEHVELPVDIIALCTAKNIEIKRVKNSRLALAELSAQAVGFPAKKLTIFGITGTKGKTTTSVLLAHILNKAGYNTALLSTAFNMINGNTFKAPLTTAQPDYLHQFFKLCVDNGVTHCVMEIAAQALSLQRIATIELDGIIFTNFAREHLEFYDSLDTYFAAKKQIFSHAKSNAVVLVNGDDSWCKQLSNEYCCFGMDKSFAVYGHSVIKDIPLEGSITCEDATVTFVNQKLSGKYNFYNCIAAVGMSLLYGISKDVCAQAVNTFDGVPGRFETYELQNGSRCIIDVAHNPISFEAILSSVRLMTHQLIVVFGAGGERDAGRRPLMGALAARFADFIILTTDNPRSEDPEVIISNINEGISNQDRSTKVTIEIDRAVAIQKAYELSCSGGIILLLGKGHEEYQIVGDVKKPFSEKLVISQWKKISER